jgi:hypothetical protein
MKANTMRNVPVWDSDHEDWDACRLSDSGHSPNRHPAFLSGVNSGLSVHREAVAVLGALGDRLTTLVGVCDRLRVVQSP